MGCDQRQGLPTPRNTFSTARDSELLGSLIITFRSSAGRMRLGGRRIERVEKDGHRSDSTEGGLKSYGRLRWSHSSRAAQKSCPISCAIMLGHVAVPEGIDPSIPRIDVHRCVLFAIVRAASIFRSIATLSGACVLLPHIRPRLWKSI